MSAADLSAAERAKIDQFLGSPLQFPPEFKNYLSDYLAVNSPFIPVSQLQGYKGTLARNAIINTEIDVNSGDAPERTWNQFDGPAITGLADGTYFVAFGCKTGRLTVGHALNKIGPAVNGSDPSVYAEFSDIDPDAMIWRATEVTAQNNDNNTIELYYWYDLPNADASQFLHRWITTIRIT